MTGIKKNKYNNLELARNLVNLRLEKAQLQGCKTYAQQALRQRMAENTKNVTNFLSRLLKAYKPAAESDYKAISDYAKGDLSHLRPWDTAYYAHKLQLERYNFDAEMLRPYFELSNVIKGVFGLAFIKISSYPYKSNTVEDSQETFKKAFRLENVKVEDQTLGGVKFAKISVPASDKGSEMHHLAAPLTPEGVVSIEVHGYKLDDPAVKPLLDSFKIKPAEPEAK